MVAAEPPTRVLDSYRIEGLLYAGPRSSLYRATRSIDGKSILLKTTRKNRPPARDLAEFANERVVLERLSNTPVVGLLGHEELDGRPWLILDDLGGQPLDAIAARFRAPEHAVRLAAKIAGALAEIHRRGVIHLDLTPNHVIILADGSVRLTGFRTASLLRVDSSVSTVRGSLAYMAPEQTGRMNRPVDKRADLYALGVTLYELLVGRLPFEGKDLLEWTHAHLAKAPTPPEQLDERVPLSASAIVLKLLSKQAEDRYHSAGGVQRDLERCADAIARGERSPFLLGSDDAPDEFRVSHRLYGREAEVAKLLAGFDRAIVGDAAVVSLVAGYSGVGKTSVVRALFQPVVRERGRFVTGKFDQYKRDIPYATLVQAFPDLIRDILIESDESFARWRARLWAALGANGRVIVDVIPELERVVGPQPEVAALDPHEAQNRFEATFLAFVRVFARRDHPRRVPG